MAFADTKKAIIDWLKAGSGLDGDHVIWTDQDSPKPSKPFLRARLKNFTRKGLPFVGSVDAYGAASVSTHNNVVLSLQYYAAGTAGDSMGSMLDLGDQLTHEGKLALLRAANVAYVGQLMGPTDACVVVDANWEDRAVMDLWLRLPWVTTDANQGFVGRVKAEGAYLSEVGITVTTVSIDVQI